MYTIFHYLLESIKANTSLHLVIRLLFLFAISFESNAQTLTLYKYSGNDIYTENILTNTFEKYAVYEIPIESNTSLIEKNTLQLKFDTLTFTLTKNFLQDLEYRVYTTSHEDTLTQITLDNSAEFFKGTVNNDINNKCRFNFYNDMITGIFNIGDSTYALQNISDFIINKGLNRVIVYNTNDLKINFEYNCGSDIDPKSMNYIENNSTKRTATYIVDIALDADKEYYERNGSSTSNTINSMLALLNQVEYYFERDLNVTFNVVFTHIWLDSIPLYIGGNDWLNVYGELWSQSSKDMIHLFSGRENVGLSNGNGNIGTLCNHCHAASWHRQNPTPYPTNYEIFLLTHEIGHVLGGNHVWDNTMMQKNSPDDGIPTLIFSQASKNEIAAYLNNNSGCINNDLFSISGPTIICNSNTTINLINPPSGLISWENSSNLNLISTSADNTSAIYRSTGNGSGYIGIAITNADTQGNCKMRKNVQSGWIHSDQITVSPTYCHNPNTYATHYASTNSHGAVLEYNWVVEPDWSFRYYLDTKKSQASIDAGYNYSVAKVHARNQCGWTSGGLTLRDRFKNY